VLLLIDGREDERISEFDGMLQASLHWYFSTACTVPVLVPVLAGGWWLVGSCDYTPMLQLQLQLLLS
jgi:hypothetical protein